MRAGSFGAVFIRTSTWTVSRAIRRLTCADSFTTMPVDVLGRDFTGLPPLRVVGGRDRLCVDSVRARRRAGERGRQGAGDDALPGGARADDRGPHARGVREIRGEPSPGPERRHDPEPRPLPRKGRKAGAVVER